MTTAYEIWIQDPFGVTLDIIDEWESVEYIRSVNDIGTATLILDGDYNLSHLRIDGRILIWRSVGDRLYIDTETAWLIRRIDRVLDNQGRKKIQVMGMSANELLTRRIVDADAGTAEAAKNTNADDLMKAIVRENLGSSASTARDWSTYLSVQGDLTLGPTVDKEFPRENVLKVLQEVSQATVQAGSSVYFDIVTNTPTTFEFRTYRDQRGLDHSFPDGINPVILAPERGSILSATRSYDYSEEATYIYAGARGTGDTRLVQSASSSTRINTSPFNRRELFVNAGNTSASDGLLDEARSALRAGRPRRLFEGEVVDIPATRYGVEWGWGDKVTVEFEGENINCTVDTVRVSVESGEEKIDVRLRAEES